MKYQLQITTFLYSFDEAELKISILIMRHIYDWRLKLKLLLQYVLLQQFFHIPEFFNEKKLPDGMTDKKLRSRK
jgi:hypothetical protein